MNMQDVKRAVDAGAAFADYLQLSLVHLLSVRGDSERAERGRLYLFEKNALLAALVLEDEVTDYVDAVALVRRIVTDHTWHSGARRHVLSGAEQYAVRKLADGFGAGLTNPDLLWDWSHVRDSSDAAFVRMALRIRSYTRAA